MKRKFTLLGLLALVTLAAIAFAVIDARTRFQALQRENTELKLQAALAEHERLHRLLATERRYPRKSDIAKIAKQYDEINKTKFLSTVNSSIDELREGLTKFSRISNDEYEMAIQNAKSLDFKRDRIHDYDANKIVAFIAEHPHIDPRILKMEPWEEGSVKISTGNRADGWGFLYVARKDGGGNWVVRYFKGCSY